MHAWAFVVSLPAGLLLLFRTSMDVGRVGAAVFAVTLAAVFGTSAAYHHAKTLVLRQRLRRADHSMIYLLIAGTYTPVCLVALPRSVGVPILVLIWSMAAVGVACKVLGGPRVMRSSSVLYIAMGWAALAAFPSLVRHIDPAALTLLIIGGILYTVGAIVLYRRRPDPAPMVFGYHEVWHLFTVLASAAHFGMVWLVLTPSA